MSWNEKQLELLIENYKNTSINGLSKIIKKGNKAIKNKLIELNLYDEELIKNNTYKVAPNLCEKLLNDSIQNAHFWGLFYSDGCIDRNRIAIGLQDNDFDYLKQISDIYNGKIYKKVSHYVYNNEKRYSYAHVMSLTDWKNIPLFINKLGIKERKTYNPPDNLNFLNSKELVIAFYIGLVDGDGTLRITKNKTFWLTSIVVHKSWYNILLELKYKLKEFCNIETNVALEKCRDRCRIMLFKQKQFKYFQDFIVENKLVCMERKWFIDKKLEHDERMSVV